MLFSAVRSSISHVTVFSAAVPAELLLISPGMVTATFSLYISLKSIPDNSSLPVLLCCASTARKVRLPPSFIISTDLKIAACSDPVSSASGAMTISPVRFSGSSSDTRFSAPDTFPAKVSASSATFSSSALPYSAVSLVPIYSSSSIVSV